MNIIEVALIALACFYLGMLFMAFWVSATQQNRIDEQEAREKLSDMFKPIGQHIHSKVPRNTIMEICVRCGERFDIMTTEDPEFDLCQDCMNYLKDHPDDPYFQERGNE